MLKQLNRLALDADGRYATASELAFLKDYLATIEPRISAYQKIREEGEIMADKIQARQKAQNVNCFTFNNQDQSSICRRDLVNAIRLSSTAVLFGELDLLRDNFLLWYRTIVKAFNYENMARSTYGKILPELMKALLDPEENKVTQPVLQLNASILSD